MGRGLFSVSLEVDDKELKRNIDGYSRKLDHIVSAVFDYNAIYGTGWMKTHAPWHDNTGAARASLLATASHRSNSHELLLAHGVHYGIWLEVAHNRRYQILQSAQRHLGQKIMSDIKTAFRTI